MPSDSLKEEGAREGPPIPIRRMGLAVWESISVVRLFSWELRDYEDVTMSANSSATPSYLGVVSEIRAAFYLLIFSLLGFLLLVVLAVPPVFALVGTLLIGIAGMWVATMFMTLRLVVRSLRRAQCRLPEKRFAEEKPNA